jgi:hypothetical protein
MEVKIQSVHQKGRMEGKKSSKRDIGILSKADKIIVSTGGDGGREGGVGFGLLNLMSRLTCGRRVSCEPGRTRSSAPRSSPLDQSLGRRIQLSRPASRPPGIRGGQEVSLWISHLHSL